MILAEGNEYGDKQTKHKSLNVSLITALAKAYRWQDQLESGQYRDLEDIAKAKALPQNLRVKGSNISRMEAFGFFAFPR
jgi:hypothetical protein